MRSNGICMGSGERKRLSARDDGDVAIGTLKCCDYDFEMLCLFFPLNVAVMFF